MTGLGYQLIVEIEVVELKNEQEIMVWIHNMKLITSFR